MLFSSFSRDFTEFVRRAIHCFSCCFRIRDDNHTQVNRFSQHITAIHKETVDPLASSCVWSVLAQEVDFIRCVDIVATPQANNLSDEEIVALTKRTQDGGTNVVEAKVGKGYATLSMAYAGTKLLMHV
ncbi:putative malate dehydrogenase [Helianthus annuus]|nr:putative malate dehydrogenase [Helianthus annuus]KAJ0939443.1 putative malate dehydrogenase [Helianthus annuus]KAJ0951313.1 putative malate dehydrogenase [Helianthus annuus]